MDKHLVSSIHQPFNVIKIVCKLLSNKG
ncbi:hypothetical protein BCEN4_740061 [Burkholderia cenocepacia]|nr:hypothetical protein BCEN4_740061 [Burkholderia cenocepacia]